MNSLVFDTGTVISLVMNNLLWTLKHLKKQYKGDFLMTTSVKKELIDRPMKSKKFKLEALVIQDYLFEGVFKLVDNKEECTSFTSSLSTLPDNSASTIKL